MKDLMWPMRQIKNLGSRFLKRQKSERVEGIPSGIDFATLRDIGTNLFGTDFSSISPDNISYQHLSGWKEAAAYRLWIESKNGSCWRVIYKNAIYNLDQIPALENLPVLPGPPEFFIYKNSNRNIANYLPDVYLCNELVPKKHYQYLLEDLSGTYYGGNGKDKIQISAQELPTILYALNELSSSSVKEDFLIYDNEYSRKLDEYARNSLESYVRNSFSPDSCISKLLKLWPKISKMHLLNEFHEYQSLQLIHGDFNLANILLHRKSRSKIKIIDWEWAGIGYAHADLASLLKRAKPELEQLSLEKFAENNKDISLIEHKRLYKWCQLERGLLDASFLAVQQMNESGKPKFSLSKYIEDSAQQVISCYIELA